MPAILYTVRTTCPTLQVRGRDLAWLSPNHVVEVMKGGATGVRIVLPDRIDDRVRGEPASREPVEPAAIVEVQYVFPSRRAFDTYLRDHASALRADSLKHFPPESGVTSERQVAEIAAEL
jgi:hypothetical protein